MNNCIKTLATYLLMILLSLTLMACKENKPVKICKNTPQEDGTRKNECKTNKKVPDAGVNGGGKDLSDMSARGSFVLFELDKAFALVDKEIVVNVQIKTDLGYINRTKLSVVRSKQHEDAARLILDPLGNVYAFIPKDYDQLDRFLASALAKTTKSVSADMNYTFYFKPVGSKPVKPTESVLRVWEKIPGQELLPVPTKIEFSSTTPLMPTIRSRTN